MISDPAILSRASDLGRAVLTINRRDFRRLHLVGTPHAGVILCTRDDDFPGQASRIHDAIAGRDDLSGEMIRVYRPC